MKNEIIIDTKDWDISEEDFDASYAKSLSKNPKRLKAFKKQIVCDYNKTKNMRVFLMNLKVVAMAEHKMSELAKAAKLERSSVYKILSSESNPSFYAIMAIMQNLGFNFNLKTA